MSYITHFIFSAVSVALICKINTLQMPQIISFGFFGMFILYISMWSPFHMFYPIFHILCYTSPGEVSFTCWSSVYPWDRTCLYVRSYRFICKSAPVYLWDNTSLSMRSYLFINGIIAVYLRDCTCLPMRSYLFICEIIHHCLRDRTC